LNKIPSFQKLFLMQVKPLQHMPESPLRKLSSDHAAPNLNGDLVLPVHRMKVRRRMIPREDTDHNSEKS